MSTLGSWPQAQPLMPLKWTEQIPQQPKQADTQNENKPSFLLSLWASVLRNLGIAVFRGQGALVCVEHIFGFSDVCHLVG